MAWGRQSVNNVSTPLASNTKFRRECGTALAELTTLIAFGSADSAQPLLENVGCTKIDNAHDQTIIKTLDPDGHHTWQHTRGAQCHHHLEYIGRRDNDRRLCGDRVSQGSKAVALQVPTKTQQHCNV